MAHWTDGLVEEVTEDVRGRLGPSVARVFERCYADTLGTTITELPDGTAFMLTGDIPAMWLRDSTAQLSPYLHVAARHDGVADLLAAVSRRQIEYLTVDPYANAFNAAPNGHGHHSDLTEMSPWVWERKYEIDSLCYPIQLAYDLWDTTGRTDHLGDAFGTAARAVVGLWRTEQDHDGRSGYRFQRFDGPASDTLARDGRGPETGPTGMTWAGFRPSDDACSHGYNVPGNLFAVVALTYIARLADEVLGDTGLAADARSLAAEIEDGVARFGTVAHPELGEVYAYEVDGLGHALLLDDANVPSLLSLPYIGWCAPDDPLYLATRSFVLSERNPTFAAGTAARGVGSPHTPARHIWPIALAVEGLTSDDPAEKERILQTLLTTDAGTSLMHESFHADDPGTFTRPWFSWANAMFCELVLDLGGLRTIERRPAVRSNAS